MFLYSSVEFSLTPRITISDSFLILLIFIMYNDKNCEATRRLFNTFSWSYHLSFDLPPMTPTPSGSSAVSTFHPAGSQ